MGIAVAVVLLADPLSPIAVVGFLALITFQMLIGWRLVALASVHAEEPDRSPAATGTSAG